MTTIWRVVAEFDNPNDAIALKEIIGELGIQSHVNSRFIAPRVPARLTRLGKLVLRNMYPSRTYTIEDVERLCLAEDYRQTSACPILSILTAEGDLERVAVGVYKKRVIDTQSTAH